MDLNIESSGLESRSRTLHSWLFLCSGTAVMATMAIATFVESQEVLTTMVGLTLVLFLASFAVLFVRLATLEHARRSHFESALQKLQHAENHAVLAISRAHAALPPDLDRLDPTDSHDLYFLMSLHMSLKARISEVETLLRRGAPLSTIADALDRDLYVHSFLNSGRSQTLAIIPATKLPHAVSRATSRLIHLSFAPRRPGGNIPLKLAV